MHFPFKSLPLFLSGLLFLLSCRSDFAVGPDERGLEQQTILFARNTSEPNASDGAERTIYLVHGDTSGLCDLSRHPKNPYPYPLSGKAFDTAPRFSPDGSKVAFLTNRDGNQELYIMEADGSNKWNLTYSGGPDLEFGWSPDGKRLVYTRLMNGKYVLHAIGVDRSRPIILTGLTDNCRYPSWSPRGNSIAFSRLLSGTSRWEVHIIDTAGTPLQAISDPTESALFPQWSKDGSRVYYVAQGVGLRVKSLDWSVDNSLPGFFPQTLSWSPDGKQFVASDSLGIMTGSADLISSYRLNSWGFDPCYSPDGNWIVFLSQNLSGVTELHVAKPDGTGEHRLLTTQYGDFFPSWKPF